MSKHILKRKTLQDLTNLPNKQTKSSPDIPNCSASDFLPILENVKNADADTNTSFESSRHYQNVHPFLGWYKHDLQTKHMSYDKFMELTNVNNEKMMYDFLMDVGLIPKSRQCQFCGNHMRVKQDKHWFWICTRRVDGVKCNRGKKSIRDGTIFDGAMLSTQTILTILWHYVHHLSEAQCAQYTSISDKNRSSIVKWYKFARTICSEWINDPKHSPKLGGYGKIVEFDESFFPGKPKYNRGRRLYEDGWEESEKWVFGMTERGSLDAVAIQVPASRSRKVLLPIIQQHCNVGTIFCSDSWKAYNKLEQHLDLEDILHYPVNHSTNYVDPDTGAHTQTIEGFWRQCKVWLPNFGLKPRYLGIYIGSFCWYRYCKQRDLDMFVQLLQSIAEKRPFNQFILPAATVSEREKKVYEKESDEDADTH